MSAASMVVTENTTSEEIRRQQESEASYIIINAANLRKVGFQFKLMDLGSINDSSTPIQNGVQREEIFLKQEPQSEEKVENKAFTVVQDDASASANASDDSESSHSLINNSGHYGKRKPYFKEHRPFQCSMCDYHAASRTNLIGHERIHTGEKPFQCGQCNYRARLNGDLIKHMRTHTNERPYSCEYCSYRANHRNTLRMHLRTHTEEKPYACNQCPFRCSSTSTMNHHRASHFKTGVKKFECGQCGFRASSKTAMSSHIRIHSVPKQECPLCKVSVSLEAFALHMENHQKNDAFVCEICQFKTKRESQYVRHILKHQKALKGKHECKKCDFATNDPLKLTTHQHIHEGESLYRCMSCAYTTPRKNSFTQHMMIHTGEKPWQCPHCDYRCRKRSLLNEHVQLKHPSVDKFVCPVPGCNFETALESVLPNHIRSHDAHAEQCPECNHTFKRKAELNKHMKIHLAKKALKCELCSFSTSSKAALTKHAKDHSLTSTTTTPSTVTIVHCRPIKEDTKSGD